ncbi:hypothetical protein [Rhizobium leguminosarum]|uniref:hypothetical protein n=1 Tax=Rhizobium leguminosarum TaxID=384 RepID=UPI001030DC5A|nr:hypothetical protein [Rhizobium leguminosarum]TAX38968.1 hypothetical protein ELI05_08365 [Rhizobium leguminosarum]
MRAFMPDHESNIIGGGGSGGDTVRKRKLRVLVKKLDLRNPEAPWNKQSSRQIEAALYEEDSRSLVLWAVLRPFLQSYAKTFPQGGLVLPVDEINNSIDQMLDQANFLLTPQLIKRHIRGDDTLSLGRLAELRYKRGTAGWEKYQQYLARELFDHARDTQVWHVDVLGRKDNNGGGAIAGYEISAGQALVDFDTYVFQPTRRWQLSQFFDRFEKKLKGKRNA